MGVKVVANSRRLQNLGCWFLCLFFSLRKREGRIRELMDTVMQISFPPRNFTRLKRAALPKATPPPWEQPITYVSEVMLIPRPLFQFRTTLHCQPSSWEPCEVQRDRHRDRITATLLLLSKFASSTPPTALNSKSLAPSYMSCYFPSQIFLPRKQLATPGKLRKASWAPRLVFLPF